MLAGLRRLSQEHLLKHTLKMVREGEGKKETEREKEREREKDRERERNR